MLTRKTKTVCEVTIEALYQDKTNHYDCPSDTKSSSGTADQIVVLNKGQIVQQGTHEQLMEQGGIYSDFIGRRKQAIGWKI